MSAGRKGTTTDIPTVWRPGYSDGYSDGEKANLEELTFYRDNAVLVTLGGDRYHRWGCYHISGRRYLIYNVGLAELRGYTPCLDCWER